MLEFLRAHFAAFPDRREEIDLMIAETWVRWDNLAVLMQLGLFPPGVADEQ